VAHLEAAPQAALFFCWDPPCPSHPITLRPPILRKAGWDYVAGDARPCRPPFLREAV